MIVKRRTKHTVKDADKNSGCWSTEEQEKAIEIACRLPNNLFDDLAAAGFPKPPVGVMEEDDARQKYEAAEVAVAEMLAGIIEWRLNRKAKSDA